MMSFEECQEWGKRLTEEKKQRKELMIKIHEEELIKKGINPNIQTTQKPKYDHPGTPDDGFVILLYIIGMVVSLLFKEFWLMWIALTLAFVKFITRHEN